MAKRKASELQQQSQDERAPKKKKPMTKAEKLAAKERARRSMQKPSTTASTTTTAASTSSNAAHASTSAKKAAPAAKKAPTTPKQRLEEARRRAHDWGRADAEKRRTASTGGGVLVQHLENVAQPPGLAQLRQGTAAAVEPEDGAWRDSKPAAVVNAASDDNVDTYSSTTDNQDMWMFSAPRLPAINTVAACLVLAPLLVGFTALHIAWWMYQIKYYNGMILWQKEE